MITIDATYMPKTTVPALEPKKVAPSITNTVSRAVHDVKGTRREVMIRWVAEGRMRVADTAGTLHPYPTISGRNARPGSPIARISRLVTTAARAR